MKLLDRLFCICFLTPFIAAAQAKATELVLLDNRVSEYQIAIPDTFVNSGMAESLNQTARLMQIAFLANGAEVAVIAESERIKTKPTIFLGDTQFARKNGVDVTQLQDWSYIHRVIGDDILIAGHDHPARGATEDRRRPNWDRVGTAKAVADFVREYLGVRFLYPDIAPYSPVSAAAKVDLLASPAIEFLPRKKVVIPDTLNVQKTPLLRLNTSHPSGGGFYDLAHNRFPRVDEVFGGHTWERAVPVEKYWETHPEYFAMISGSRKEPVVGKAQYCLSNADVQELIYRDLASWLDRGYASVDLGQPDGFQQCQCDACKDLFDTGDDWSEKIWLFNRLVAQRLSKSHSGRDVTMMSYILTAQPPKAFDAFPANTCIMLTGTNEEDIAPWRGIDVPRGFTGYVYNWCPNLGTRYTPMRTPGFVEDQVKRLAANRIQSLYRDGPGQLFGLEGPVFYVMGRMFDDPDQNSARELLKEFYEAAFIDPSTVFYMRSFYDQLYHAIALYSNHIGTRCDVWTYQSVQGEGRPRKTVQDPFQLIAFLYTPNMLAALDSDLTQAEKLASTEKVKTRLALVRTEFEYVRHLARVVHLYQAYQVLPDDSSLERLLDAIDARDAFIAALYDERGNGRPSSNWSHVLFPFAGHDAKHLRLAYDGYQEPYANTCLNWDTDAVRNAPTIGTKRLMVSRINGPVTLDSPRWEQAAEHSLMFVPPLTRLPRKTTLRLFRDDTNLYLLGSSDLEPDHPTEFPPLDRDQALNNQESIDFYVQPQLGREVFYRFAFGVGANAKYDAASGFVTDPIDPRFGKDDSTWNGQWQTESRIDAKNHRWQVLVTIPFATLAVDSPSTGTSWRANFGRNHLLPRGVVDRSIWSSTPSSTSMDDRGLFGEVVFE
ncbi:MAG TPA: hypothetical protein DDZ51_11095 [Planctomycetaceae bacterium]|nr:hypothetical protein [Planctomycetaceae bacterium]